MPLFIIVNNWINKRTSERYTQFFALACDFLIIWLREDRSSHLVNLLQILRTPFPKNTSEGLLLRGALSFILHFQSVLGWLGSEVQPVKVIFQISWGLEIPGNPQGFLGSRNSKGSPDWVPLFYHTDINKSLFFLLKV